MRSGRPIWEDALTAEEAAMLDPGPTAGPGPGRLGNHDRRLERRPDVLIVGGGMVGLATAVSCARAGLGHVTVVEQNTLGAGASGGAAGLLVPDTHEGTDPEPVVRLGRLSLAAWQRLNALSEELPALTTGKPSESGPGGLGLLPLDWLGLGPFPPGVRPDLSSVAHPLTADEVQTLVPDLATPANGVLIPGQARVNPLRALARLAGILAALGGAITTSVTVFDVVIRGDRVVTVATSGGDVSPGTVVFATGGPPGLPNLPLDITGEMVKGHLLVTQPSEVKLPGSVAPFGTGLEDGRVLSGGTLDDNDSTPQVQPGVVSEIRSRLDDGLPALRGVATSHRWCCFRPAVADRIPVIDRVPGLTNAWVTCGHFRTGILMAPATGDLVARWMLDDEEPADVHPFRIQGRTLRKTSWPEREPGQPS
jgi:glycine oxidase